jgi:hypothetical protein
MTRFVGDPDTTRFVGERLSGDGEMGSAADDVNDSSAVMCGDPGSSTSSMPMPMLISSMSMVGSSSSIMISPKLSSPSAGGVCGSADVKLLATDVSETDLVEVYAVSGSWMGTSTPADASASDMSLLRTDPEGLVPNDSSTARGRGLDAGVFQRLAPLMTGEKVVSQSTRAAERCVLLLAPDTTRCCGLPLPPCARELHLCGRHPMASRMYARYVRWSISTSVP